MHLGQVVHGKVAQLIPHQKQPLQTAKFLEDAVRQLAEIVVADFEAFQVRQPIEAARRHAWYVVELERAARMEEEVAHIDLLVALRFHLQFLQSRQIRKEILAQR